MITLSTTHCSCHTMNLNCIIRPTICDYYSSVFAGVQTPQPSSQAQESSSPEKSDHPHVPLSPIASSGADLGGRPPVFCLAVTDNIVPLHFKNTSWSFIEEHALWSTLGTSRGQHLGSTQGLWGGVGGPSVGYMRSSGCRKCHTSCGVTRIASPRNVAMVQYETPCEVCVGVCAAPVHSRMTCTPPGMTC